MDGGSPADVICRRTRKHVHIPDEILKEAESQLERFTQLIAGLLKYPVEIMAIAGLNVSLIHYPREDSKEMIPMSLPFRSIKGFLLWLEGRLIW